MNEIVLTIPVVAILSGQLAAYCWLALQAWRIDVRLSRIEGILEAKPKERKHEVVFEASR